MCSCTFAHASAHAWEQEAEHAPHYSTIVTTEEGEPVATGDVNVSAHCITAGCSFGHLFSVFCFFNVTPAWAILAQPLLEWQTYEVRH